MLDETLAEHLFSGLFHLEFAREVLLRTGNVSAFDRLPWQWGDEAYTGMPDSQILEENVNTVLKMTEPRLRADISPVDYLNGRRPEWWRALLGSGGRRLEREEEVPIEEPDFGCALTLFSTDPALLGRYRAGMARMLPALNFFVHDPEPEPPPYSCTCGRSVSPEPDSPDPNFLILIDPHTGHPADTIYNLARRIIDVWEEEKLRLEPTLDLRYAPDTRQ